MFISSIWLAIHPSNKDNSNVQNYSPRSNPFLLKLNSFFPILLTFSLAVHFGAGVHRTMYDFYRPYSAGKATAAYIKEKGWTDAEIFGSRDVEVSTVAGYLDKDFYYPEIQGYGSYAQWKKRKSLNREETLEQLQSYFEGKPSLNKALLVLSRGSSIKGLEPGQAIINGNIRILADQKFEKSWTDPERFYLYWAERLQ